MKKSVSLVLVLAMLITLLTGIGALAEDAQPIAVVFTTDVHCHVDDKLGYAGVAAVKKQLAEQGYNVFLVDSGDVIQGAPAGSLSKGSVPIDIMNYLGYDCMAIGNHEFDYGQEVLAARVAQANFPILSLNFRNIETGEPVYTPYTIVERGGVKIAFLGVTTPTAITSSTPIYFMNDAGEFIYDFMQDGTGETLWAAVQANVDAARAEGADYVIVISHLGVEVEAAPYLSGNLIENTTGIDAVLDGHSHQTIASNPVKNKEGKAVAFAQSSTQLATIGVLTIENGEIKTQLITEVEADADAAAFITDAQAEITAFKNQIALTLTYDLVINDPETGVRIVRNNETNLGDLCADAARYATGADIAISNGGGVRDTLTGDVTYGNLLSVHPFGNDICIISATGADILDMLEMSVKDVPNEFGGFLQVSGLTFTYDPTIESPVILDAEGMLSGFTDGERRVKEVLIGGEPLDPEKTYTVGGVSYILHNKGNGYANMANCEVLMSTVAVDFDCLLNYITEVYPTIADQYVNPYGEGRIVAIQ